MIIQFVNTAGRVLDSINVKVEGARPEWVFVGGTVFIFRERVGNLHRYHEAPGLIFSKPEAESVAPAPILPH